MRINKNDVGRWGTVKFDDMGRVDGILVSVIDDQIKFFNLANGSLDTIDRNQIVELRGYLQADQESNRK